ncbi:hypothetical protein ACHAWF_012565 [Thalassiosira exigua]
MDPILGAMPMAAMVQRARLRSAATSSSSGIIGSGDAATTTTATDPWSNGPDYSPERSPSSAPSSSSSLAPSSPASSSSPPRPHRPVAPWSSAPRRHPDDDDDDMRVPPSPLLTLDDGTTLTRSQAPGIGWTPDEDALLRRVADGLKRTRGLRLRIRSDWEECSRSLAEAADRDAVVGPVDGRTAIECRERWTRYLRPGRKAGGWTEGDDAAVLRAVFGSKEHRSAVAACEAAAAAVDRHREGGGDSPSKVAGDGGKGFVRWSELADSIPALRRRGRTGKQIRDRWVNHLDPRVCRDPFSNADDKLLWDAFDRHGKQWAQIGIVVYEGTRSENQVKNRWYSAEFKKWVAGRFGAGAYEEANEQPSPEKAPRSPRKRVRGGGGDDDGVDEGDGDGGDGEDDGDRGSKGGDDKAAMPPEAAATGPPWHYASAAAVAAEGLADLQGKVLERMERDSGPSYAEAVRGAFGAGRGRAVATAPVVSANGRPLVVAPYPATSPYASGGVVGVGVPRPPGARGVVAPGPSSAFDPAATARARRAPARAAREDTGVLTLVMTVAYDGSRYAGFQRQSATKRRREAASAAQPTTPGAPYGAPSDRGHSAGAAAQSPEASPEESPQSDQGDGVAPQSPAESPGPRPDQPHSSHKRSKPPPVTVQHQIETALQRWTGLSQAALRVRGAGRTDRGVHASGQVVAFDVPWDMMHVDGGDRGVDDREATGDEEGGLAARAAEQLRGACDALAAHRLRSICGGNAKDEASAGVRGADQWQIRRALATRLPDDVIVRSVRIWTGTRPFEPRREISRKTYVYKLRFRHLADAKGKVSSAVRGLQVHPICNAGPHLLRRIGDGNAVWLCPWPLDPALLIQACEKFVGRHDFSNFVHKEERRKALDPKATPPAPGKKSPHDIDLTQFKVDVTPEEDGDPALPPVINATFTLQAKGFHRSMVRNLVGFTVDVARGARYLNNIPLLLMEDEATQSLIDGISSTKPLASIVHSAPACGLCLSKVEYEQCHFL